MRAGARGYSADADYSPRAWLIHKTGITRGAAVSYTAWAKRAAAHPQVAKVLAAGELSESFARTLCTWTDKLPGDCREAADEILLAAAAAGMELRDLAGLFAEIYQRSRPDEPDEDPGRPFEDRSVRLETTFDGAGILNADLTPDCAAIVGAVLDALSAPAGAEDTRSHAQRCHDALQEGMSTLSPPLLPDPVVPPKMPCSRVDGTRQGVASSNGPRSTGWVIDITDGPGHGIAPACGSISSTRAAPGGRRRHLGTVQGLQAGGASAPAGGPAPGDSRVRGRGPPDSSRRRDEELACSLACPAVLFVDLGPPGRLRSSSLGHAVTPPVSRVVRAPLPSTPAS